MNLRNTVLFLLLAASTAASAEVDWVEIARSRDAERGGGNAGAGGTAPAAPSAEFRQLDTNRDGFLSEAEMSAPAASRFNWVAIDRDGDGRISPGEFAAAASGHVPDTRNLTGAAK